MKYLKHFFLPVTIILCSSNLTFAQMALGYGFIPTEYGAYNELSEGIISIATGEDGAENINLPFDFEYMGITYSTARISVNGWLEMGQTYTGPGFENELQSTTKKPLICPLWDDLSADSESEIKYYTAGEYPARFFIVQWKNMKFIDGGRKSFQLRLWELDGTIDFIYGPETSTANNSFSVGLNNHIGGEGNFISVTIEGLYYPIDTMLANNNNNNVSLLTEGMYLSFLRLDRNYAIMHQTPDTLIAGSSNQKIISIIIGGHFGGVLTLPWVTKFNFNTNGTSNTSDILNARLYTTGSYPLFNTSNQLGEIYPHPDGLFEIGNFGYNSLNNNGLTYFWLTYDISPNALDGNFVDGNCYKIDREGCCPSLTPDTSFATTRCIVSNPVSVENNKVLPDIFTLEQNYPNPFNPTTKIKFTIPTPPSSSPFAKGRTEEGFVTLKVYDVIGNEIATLINEEKPAGEYEVDFNGTGLTSGIYFYQLKAGSFVKTKKMILLK